MDAAIGVAALEEEVVEVVGEMRCATRRAFMRRALSTLTRARLVVGGCFRIQAVTATLFSISFIWRRFWRSMLWGHAISRCCNGYTTLGLT